MPGALESPASITVSAPHGTASPPPPAALGGPERSAFASFYRRQIVIHCAQRLAQQDADEAHKLVESRTFFGCLVLYL
jgi:hypothetical protein